MDQYHQPDERFVVNLSARALANVLDDVEALIKRFVVFASDHEARAIALWTAHTFAIDASDATPYLAITSPEMRSGKTRLLEVLELVARDATTQVRMTEALLFRMAAEGRCLLIDEVDTIFRGGRGSEAIRAVLNGGHRRGATVSRTLPVG